MLKRFPTAYAARALTIADLRKQLSTARTYVMYAHTRKVRDQAMEAVEVLRSELAYRGEPA